MKLRMSNIQKGYAELYYYADDDTSENRLLYSGYVHTENIPTHTDFDTDEIYYTTRWCTYISMRCDGWGFAKIGRETGYVSRALAIQGFEEYIRDLEGF